MHRLERPTLASRSSYARRSQDPVFWQPYLDEVLRRHGLPPRQAILGTGGTYTTLILPPVPNHTPRGLDIMLRLLSSA